MLKQLYWISWMLLALLGVGMPLQAADVVVVQGTTSAPNAAERNYAERTTKLISRWLTDVGIQHAVVIEEDLGAKTLSGARVVILGYNPQPTASTLTQLRQVRKLGGKLIVCYGQDAALAQLMMVKLGQYRKATKAGQWSALRFDSKALPYLPGLVQQSSNNIRLVEPIAGKSRVIATWQDLAGRSTGDPAWLQSDAGFWMTHVLIDDGDTWHKQQVLLAMIADSLPDVWRDASARAVSQVGVIGRFTGMESMTSQIDRLARAKGNAGVVTPMLVKARALQARILHLQKTHKHPEVVLKCHELNALLLEAYGLGQRAVVPEVRAVWDHSGEGLYPGDWRKTAAVLASHGVTDVFVDVLWPGSAHYDSKVAKPSETFVRQGDQLAASLAAARPAGLRLHAWKVCWNLDRAEPELLAALKREGRLQVTDTGEAIPWLCPSDERNLKLEKDAVRELVGRYDVDGIHLDYIRYRDWHSCYCGGCRERFSAATGVKLTAWPQDVKSGTKRERFLEWRAGIITRFVEDVSTLARQRRPKIRVSAAVFGKYPQCVGGVGQDWGLWLKRGLVDFVCPMNYTGDLRVYAALVDAQMALPGAKGRIYPGIGVSATESRLSAVDVIDQIRLTRRTAAGGFALFDLNRRLETEIFPILKLGVMSER